MGLFGSSKITSINDSDINLVKQIFPHFENEANRKRAFLSFLALKIVTDYLLKKKYDVNNYSNFINIPSILEQFDVADITINGVRADLRIILGEEQTSLRIPKSHFDLGIEPQLYIGVKFNNDLTECKILGFVETHDIDKDNIDGNYYNFEIEKLSSIKKLTKQIKYILPKDIIVSEEAASKAEDLFLGLIDKEINQADRDFLLKHLAVSLNCRIKLAELSIFDERYALLKGADIGFKDYTLDLFTGNIPASSEEISIPINEEPEEDFEDMPLPEKKATSQHSFAPIIPIVPIVPIANIDTGIGEGIAGVAGVVGNLNFGGSGELTSAVKEIEIIESIENKELEELVSEAEPDTDSELEIESFLENSDVEELAPEEILKSETDEERSDEIIEMADEEDLEKFINDESFQIEEPTIASEEIEFSVDEQQEPLEINELEEVQEEEPIELSDDEIEDETLESDNLTEEPQDNEFIELSDDETALEIDDEVEKSQDNELIELNDLAEEPQADAKGLKDSLEEIEDDKLLEISDEEELREEPVKLDEFETHLEIEEEQPLEEIIAENSDLTDGFDEEEIENTSEEETPAIDDENPLLGEDILMNFFDEDENEEPVYRIPEEDDNVALGNDIEEEESSESNDDIRKLLNDEDDEDSVDTSKELDISLLFDEEETNEPDEIGQLFKEKTEAIPPQSPEVTAPQEIAKPVPSKPNNKVLIAAVSIAAAGALAFVGYNVYSANNSNVNPTNVLNNPQAMPNNYQTVDQFVGNNNPGATPQEGTQPGLMPPGGAQPGGMPQQLPQGMPTTANNPQANAGIPNADSAVPSNLNDAMAKAFSPNAGANEVRINNISWEVGVSLAKNEQFKKYLIQAGQALKINLSQNLLVTTDKVYTDQIKVDVTMDSKGNISKNIVTGTSGSQQIDNIVLKTVKDTLNFTKLPPLEANRKFIELGIIIEF